VFGVSTIQCFIFPFHLTEKNTNEELTDKWMKTTTRTTTTTTPPETRATTIVEPILILPGLFASYLQAKLTGTKPPHFYCRSNRDWYTLWMAPEQLVPGFIDCLVHNFELIYNENNNTFSNKTGVQIRPMDFGGIKGAPYLANFTKTLVDHGYQAGKTLRIASFDWRLASRNYLADGEFQKLANLIEEMYYANNNTRIHLMGHSYGGPYAYWFVTRFASQEWKDKFVASIISLGAPFLGSGIVSVALANATSFFQALPENARGPFTVLGKALKNFPSIISMLPSETYLKGVPIITTATKNYTAEMSLELLSDYGADLARVIRKNNADDYNNLPHPHTKFYCVVGYGLPTPTVYHFASSDLSVGIPPTMGDGDGAITSESLEFCSEWVGKDPNNEVIVERILNAEHAAMPDLPDVYNYILSITTK
jgi:lysophospholipase-3